MAVIQQHTEEFGDDRATLYYLITGESTRASALAALKSTAGTTLGSLVRRAPYVRKISTDSDTSWQGVVPYGRADRVEDPPEADTERTTFEIGGSSTLRTWSANGTYTAYPAAAETPNFYGAINVDENGTVNGVEWPTPASQVIGVEKILASADVTNSYIEGVSATVGKVNSGTFLGFAAGEIMFLGASGERMGTAGDWRVLFRFGYSTNQTSIVIPRQTGGNITVTTKNGWDYLWVYFETQEHTGSKKLLPMPVAAYVHAIAETSDFADLSP